jgi:hypothetical protein
VYYLPFVRTARFEVEQVQAFFLQVREKVERVIFRACRVFLDPQIPRPQDFSSCLFIAFPHHRKCPNYAVLALTAI